VNGLARFLTQAPIVRRRYRLLQREGGEDAEHNDCILIQEFAPSVQRFGKMEMHYCSPAIRRRLPDGLMSAMGRKLTFRQWQEWLESRLTPLRWSTTQRSQRLRRKEHTAGRIQSPLID